jgi:hypothetical protein
LDAHHVVLDGNVFKDIADSWLAVSGVPIKMPRPALFVRMIWLPTIAMRRKEQ